MEFIAWILFGALAGWIASIIMGTNEEQGAIGNIVIGILGAFLGGFLYRSLIGGDTEGFGIESLLVAIGGSVLLLAIVRAFRRRGAHEV